MTDFSRLTAYAREKVQATETPLNLYNQAQVKKNVIDTMVTVAIASVVLAFSTTLVNSKATIQSPAMKKFIEQEMVASRTTP